MILNKKGYYIRTFQGNEKLKINFKIQSLVKKYYKKNTTQKTTFLLIFVTGFKNLLIIIFMKIVSFFYFFKYQGHAKKH